MTRLHRLFIVVTLISVATVSSRAQSGVVSLTALDTPVTQDFDSLASSGTSSALPAGWLILEAGANANLTYTAGTGSSNTGDTYSFGAASSPERALGGLRSGNLIPTFGAVFQNNTGATITSLDIAYRGEHWRTGFAGRQDRIDFQYSLDATSLASGTWTDVDTLDFSSPASTAGAKDGNLSPPLLVGTIASVAIPQGANVYIRWTDFNAADADDGLAVDDFQITPHGVSDPLPTLTVDDVTVNEGNSETTTATFTVTLSSTDHDGVDFTLGTEDDTATTGDNDYQPKSQTFEIPEGSPDTTFSFAVTVNSDETFEPNETFNVVFSNVAGATVVGGNGVGTITNDDAPPPVVTDVVISQVYGSGGNSGATYTHDFIELFNQGSSAVNLSGWSVQYASAGGTSWQVTPLTGTIAPGGYFLVRESPNTASLPAPDATGTINMSGTAGKVALSNAATAFTGSCPVGAVDFVGYGSSASCSEGAPAPAPSATTAAVRKRRGCVDSDNNSLDFGVGTPAPRNTASPLESCVFTFTPAAIHDIQGPGATSPFAGADVSTSGVVTAIKSNGFFLQTPDGAADSNANTSEAIFVFTAALPAVTVGHQVSVRGTVAEFFSLTQIDSSVPGDVSVTGGSVPLPAAVTLTSTHLDPMGTPAQLEPLESMRVAATSLTSVAPTADFGEIDTVLTGVPRPMRAPGIPISDPVPPDPSSGVPDCCIPRFDDNPERLVLDTDGLVGQPIVTVTSNTVIGAASGPLDFTFGRFKLLPENTLMPGPGMSGVPVRDPLAGEFTIGGFNIEQFTGDETQKRKSALAIAQLMRLPDVIGHIEVGSQAALQALADQVNADEMTAGRPNPAYVAELRTATGNQHLGFLVKSSRVRIDSVTQEPAGTFGTSGAVLHDRPPLVLRATVDPSGLNPRPVIVVLNHTRSFIDVELVDEEGARVREKRRLQAESIAQLLQDLQTLNPGVLVTTIGDFNAYQFSDGYTDPIATMKGSPTADEFIVEDASPDVVDPNFVNLTDGLPADQQYSFIFEGTPQALDHMLVNTTGAAWVTGYQIARGNSDFPDAFSSDATRPEKASDHDMPVAYYTFPPPSTDLSVAKASTSTSVTVGDTVTFTVTVTNNGTAPAQNVVVADHLPSGLTATSCTASGGGVCGGTTTTPNATFALLPAGASETVTIVATAGCGVPNGAALTNIATVTSSTADPNTTNNTASAGVTAVNAPPTITGASASRTFLLPLHLLIPVEIAYNATDACGAVTTTLTVTSNEPVTGPIRQQGLAGLTSPDWVVVNNHLVLLRGEKAEKGTGRIYTITITATDAAGGQSTQQVTVRVPKSLLEIIFH